ncbi:hypothetical protein Rmet_6765 (plasmid) [Cupriavidus metallidurans CH34]|uniref:Uncharacterized protein n=1 Tax=Cupriavidus metallidurans (strain ATCC 43123 / DSM 2839 / NBRC 102507 / CH34) TaxID=266264 RepID=D3DYH3_CUPMC|nr:hypothetical protein Rmet_6765 [Cupriavidus metallidurans CH34]
MITKGNRKQYAAEAQQSLYFYALRCDFDDFAAQQRRLLVEQGNVRIQRAACRFQRFNTFPWRCCCAWHRPMCRFCRISTTV